MTKIKLCGLRRREDVAMVNRAKPDYAGFVFAPGRRQVTAEQAESLRRQLDPAIAAVGVFVNAPMETILSLVKDGTLKAVQLHGQESQSYLTELKKQVSVPVIRAFSIHSAADLEKAQKSPADFVLLDNGAGGTGAAFDWSLFTSFDRPFFLAGGLRPDNITKAISRFQPYALDLSSGVETDGYKDKEKIIAAVAAVRR